MAQLQRLVITPAQLHGQQLCLTQQQQHYLSHVLRLGAGDRFIALDGQGHAWLAQLSQRSPAEADLLEPMANQTELPCPITLVMALPKGNGFDEVVRQATELGVACIVPVISDRTLLQPSPQRRDRWRRIAQEAAEQSERQIVPTILEPISFAKHLQAICDSSTPKFLCVTRHSAPHLLTQIQPYPPLPVSLAVGPEGGWTEAEVEAAIAAGYQPVSLGDRILRTVTAPIVALALVASVYESQLQP